MAMPASRPPPKTKPAKCANSSVHQLSFEELEHDLSDAGSKATYHDGSDAFGCRQSEASQRLGAVNWLSWTPAVHRVTDLPLLKTPEAPILAP